jgi:aarF domain-containing kinase
MPRPRRILLGSLTLFSAWSLFDDRPLRSLRALFTFSGVALDYQLNGKTSQVHTRTGQRVLELCLQLGGPFIKAGQFVAAMNHTVPKEITQVLAQLQDSARPQGLEYVLKVIREEIGDVFESVEEIPVGAASLAQVHRAKMKSGEWVAVKVQYPGLESIVHADLNTMSWIAFIAAKTFLKADFTWMVTEFKESLLSELDFEQEAKRAERVAENLKEDKCFYVPRVFHNLSSKKVLTMEFVEGCKVSEIEKIEKMGFNPKNVARKAIEMFSRMIYIDGFIHCDP